jgi:hypothetical protein
VAGDATAVTANGIRNRQGREEHNKEWQSVHFVLNSS